MSEKSFVIYPQLEGFVPTASVSLNRFDTLPAMLRSKTAWAAARLLLALALCSLTHTVDAAKRKREEPIPPPKHGWCQGDHKPKKPKAAQSGHGGFCKSCFAKRYPEEHAAKLQKRREAKKPCKVCGEPKELQSSGLCRPCSSARSCETCGAINAALSVTCCLQCAKTREKLGAKQRRLALWCPT